MSKDLKKLAIPLTVAWVIWISKAVNDQGKILAVLVDRTPVALVEAQKGPRLNVSPLLASPNFADGLMGRKPSEKKK